VVIGNGCVLIISRVYVIIVLPPYSSGIFIRSVVYCMRRALAFD